MNLELNPQFVFKFIINKQNNTYDFILFLIALTKSDIWFNVQQLIVLFDIVLSL